MKLLITTTKWAWPERSLWLNRSSTGGLRDITPPKEFANPLRLGYGKFSIAKSFFCNQSKNPKRTRGKSNETVTDGMKAEKLLNGIESEK